MVYVRDVGDGWSLHPSSLKKINLSIKQVQTRAAASMPLTAAALSATAGRQSQTARSATADRQSQAARSTTVGRQPQDLGCSMGYVTSYNSR